MAEALKPINGGGFQLYPYNTHKEWIVTNVNYRQDYYSVSILKGISPAYNEKIPVSESVKFPAYRDTTEIDNSNSNSTDFLNKKHQKVVWSGLNQMFFKHRVSNERELYTSASILSVPYNRMGDGIHPNSISIIDYSVSSSQLNISDRKIDEYHGYLIDTNLNTGSHVPFGDLVGYWGFNDEVVARNTKFDSKIKDGSGYGHYATGTNLQYSPGILTTGGESVASGTKVTFNGTNSYIKINHNKQLDFFKNSNYAISLWSILPTSQSDVSDDCNWILSKSGTQRDYGQDNQLRNVLRHRNAETPIFPFDLKVYNQNTSDNGKIVASLSDGLTSVINISNTKINDNSQHHILFNKTGSLLELWVDGVKEVSSSVNLKGQISNTFDMLIGSKFISDSEWDVTSNFKALSGSVDEVRIYRRGLSETEIVGLSNNHYVTGSAYQTNIVGEVFYKHGIMVISDPRPIYTNVWTGETSNWDYGTNYGFRTKYKSTKQLHEVSVLCEVGSDEFNVSQNPSLKKNNDVNSEFLQPFVTGSSFSPYFTSIGLYNPNGDLIAIGKFASAIKTRPDVDITIKVRFDLDGPFGTPSIGSLEPEGRNVTLFKRADGKYIWNKLDKLDI
jgi:hypothetical protein